MFVRDGVEEWRGSLFFLVVLLLETRRAGSEPGDKCYGEIDNTTPYPVPFSGSCLCSYNAERLFPGSLSLTRIFFDLSRLFLRTKNGQVDWGSATIHWIHHYICAPLPNSQRNPKKVRKENRGIWVHNRASHPGS
ncbi:hypothetical protein BO99DRAFT_132265 [Aspergillus violaceofuscus CBS 115571]|uniref:Secreted protein n=1 Tax=Aspergillus violaceofuscus (strain CBS 115571) TaxID=1450538 RepID=A0A2V5HC19_ASPV1|nr:hypothetical protein BO99DRAFT_132265 [Aspergillus violaceofuscus CBS 115571]